MSRTMTTEEAIAWIVSRDEEFSANCAHMNSIRLTVAIAQRNSDCAGAVGPHIDSRPAIALLIKACRHGLIATDGLKGDKEGSATSDRLPMSVPDWADIEITAYHQNTLCAVPASPPGRPIRTSAYWYEMHFDREDVKSAFPPITNTEPTLSPSPAIPRGGKEDAVVEVCLSLWPPSGRSPIGLSAQLRDRAIRKELEKTNRTASDSVIKRALRRLEK
jgi:hypothetical protein